MPPGTNDVLQTYIAQNRDTQVLLLILFALFVVWQVFRSFGGRDKTLSTLVTQLSTVIGNQSEAADKRDQEYQALFKEISERNAKADHRWQLVLEQNTAAQTLHTAAVKAMDARTGHLLLTIQTLDSNISTSTLNLTALLALENEIKADVNKIYDLMRRLFPVDEPVSEMVEQIIVGAVKEACTEKRATDERPVVLIPPIESMPESDIPAPPGAGEQPNAA